MLHRLARLLAAGMVWQHPLRGAASAALMFTVAGLLLPWLSPAEAVRGNNHSAATGVIVAALAAAGYVIWRVLRYAVKCRRGELAPETASWTAAAAETSRYLGLNVLVAILTLAPIVGRQGVPLWYLGYDEPCIWFTAGATAQVALLALIWPDWLAPRGRRLLPRVP